MPAPWDYFFLAAFFLAGAFFATFLAALGAAFFTAAFFLTGALAATFFTAALAFFLISLAAFSALAATFLTSFFTSRADFSTCFRASRTSTFTWWAISV